MNNRYNKRRHNVDHTDIYSGLMLLAVLISIFILEIIN